MSLAEIGEYVVLARRSDQTWFLGGLNAKSRRMLEIPLSFLDADRQYTAHIYRDGAPDGSDSRKVTIERNPVRRGDVLTIDAAANGGFAARIVPESRVLPK